LASSRCVLFDAVGTLIYPAPPVALAYGALARKHGSLLDDAEIDERFRKAFRRQEALDAEPNGFLTDAARELRRWQTIVGEVFDDLPDTSAVFAELWQHFAQPKHWQLFDDVADAWQTLAVSGIRLGIASNFDGRLRQVCAGLAPLDGCDQIFISSELGGRKPSAEFFRRIENTTQLAAGEILLVGDDWSNDYLAAQSAGWQAVFLDRSGQQASSAETIHSLAELPRKVGLV
jgi:putative hydrolase of the HAD superfamily